MTGMKSPLALDTPTQTRYEVRFDWGASGLRSIAPEAGVIVVVDSISFTTTVELAVASGLSVTPFAGSRAEAETAELGDAVLAGRRGEAGITLSPTRITPDAVAAIAPATRVVMPSFNGSRVSALAAEYGVPVIAAGLRNRSAVAAWILRYQEQHGDRVRVAIIASGEVREDDSVRFAVEDQLAAGAIVDALAEVGIDYSSPEAAAACAAFTGLRRAVGHLYTASVTAQQLIEAGQGDDVRLAAQADASTTVPVLVDGAFVAG